MAIVHGHIDDMVAEGIPANKIVVGGFSQGGCMSLVSTLTYPKTYVLCSLWRLRSALLINLPMVYLQKADLVHEMRSLAGGICLSGWAAMQDQYGELIQPANKGTPLLWGHGAADPTVVTACQAAGVKALTDAGLAVQVETYAGLGHGKGHR